jgi:phage-related protein
LDIPILRPVVWLGDAKRHLRQFPEGARKLIGDELQLIQFGGMPRDTKPFKGVGSGVLEIAVRYDKDAFRTIVAVQLGKKLYVLHAFQKKSRHGIETPKRDIELIKRRYRDARELASHEEKEDQV